MKTSQQPKQSVLIFLIALSISSCALSDQEKAFTIELKVEKITGEGNSFQMKTGDGSFDVFSRRDRYEGLSRYSLPCQRTFTLEPDDGVDFTIVLLEGDASACKIEIYKDGALLDDGATIVKGGSYDVDHTGIRDRENYAIYRFNN